MTSEVDLASAVATELVKQVPIKEAYQDGVSPAMRETGSALADFVKTLRVALAPLQFTAALQDRYVAFLDRSVRKIPEERRILPAPQIAGPILEAIKYEPDDTPIAEMYNELLSKAFDRGTARHAHPAFAPLIKQLSVDEAVILRSIYEKLLNNGHYNFQCTDDYDPHSNRFFNRKVELDELPRDGLLAPENVAIYVEHLDKLGLVAAFQFKNQEPIFSGGRQSGSRTFARYQLTGFGHEFMKAVQPLSQ
ncbi:DUF4393 domain-containing protein [Bradyrhizobium sp. NBAIM01]|uniref:DUF4393 domain-containing protein n=1 Tax=Bradyrhizobium sp. NBAIM01 TaxID=2793818 RepID=UPI001CD22F39|nr:DUF4393 domain-containing protein [Bradyrhizobium sp. NBAIM01]MCA1510255.1 DUF4393 domain-containing protein [Bradyrhizobium sp. NBAIM01]